MNMHNPSTEIVPRKTVEQLVAQRDRALELYAEGHAALMAASDAVGIALDAARAACHGVNRYNFHQEREAFHTRLKVAERDAYMAVARRMIDTDVWAHLIELTDLERLMDKTAKDQFNSQLLSAPPEITVDNVFATLETFLQQSGSIFKRGIAHCFSNLDRRFRSHDGWKIGGRIILTYCFDEWGGWNYHRAHDDTIRDVERVFRVLDDNPSSTCESVDTLRRARNFGSGARQTEIETEYFKVRAFKNGNAHIWFKRDDLLEKVNKILGDYYGAPIPEDREPDKHTGLYDPKTLPAKRFGFFPTPDVAADHLIEKVSLLRSADEPQLTILEPSAGTGNLALRCIKTSEGWPLNRASEYRFDNAVDCVEIQTNLAEALARMGKFRQIFRCDFLSLLPGTTGLYDRVVMNPPFDRERDIDHVMHALKFLKPDGFLTAIMSASTEFRETRKSVAFRELMDKMKASWSDLPPGSFVESGTYANAIILRVWKDGRTHW